jgi:hypothetical protein
METTRLRECTSVEKRKRKIKDKDRGEVRGAGHPFGDEEGILRAAEADAGVGGVLVERDAAVAFVAVPGADGFPDAVFVGDLFGLVIFRARSAQGTPASRDGPNCAAPCGAEELDSPYGYVWVNDPALIGYHRRDEICWLEFSPGKRLIQEANAYLSVPSPLFRNATNGTMSLSTGAEP